MPPPQPVADVALEHSGTVETLTEQADGITKGITPAVTDPARWRDAVATEAPNLLGLQAVGVAEAGTYVSRVFEAQGADPAADAEVVPEAFLDFTDGGGSWMRNLVYAPPSAYRDAIAAGVGDTLARYRAAYVARAIVADGMRDASRAAVGTSMVSRRRFKGYVRMLRGKSCARCAILAGRRYFVSGFRRHPRCDCINVPMAEDTGRDWTTSPSRYFDSLTAAEQDAIFTKAGAETIRLARNTEVTMGQVVNARQGMTVTSSFGRDVSTTSYGTSVRGLYGGYDVQPDGTLVRRPGGDTTRQVIGTNANGSTRTLRFANTPRLMPDEIFQLAETEGWDRAEVLRQLQRFGYITT